MADQRYKATLIFEANEQDAEEGDEPMVRANIVWNRNSYTGLTMLEDNLVNGVLGKTVEYAKSSSKYKGLTR